MNINLHIERLVIEGLPVESRHAAIVKEAIEAELIRLLTENGLSAALRAGGSTPRLRADSMQLGADQNPLRVGEQIARAIYGGINQ